MAAVPSIGRANRVEETGAPEADLTRALYERHAHQIFRYCLHQLGSREEAEDAVQSTFLNAFRGIKRGIVPELEAAWLFKIAHNVCLSRRRSSRRRGRIESPTDFDVVEELAPAPARRADELIGLQDALEQLPEQQRRAILLREWQGLSYREIAAELALSQAAVETLIFRARRSLAHGLERPAETGRRRSRLAAGALGNLLSSAQSFLCGGGAAAVKIAAAVAVVGAGTAVVSAPVHRQLPAERPAGRTTTSGHSPGRAQARGPAAPAAVATSAGGAAASTAPARPAAPPASPPARSRPVESRPVESGPGGHRPELPAVASARRGPPAAAPAAAPAERGLRLARGHDAALPHGHGPRRAPTPAAAAARARATPAAAGPGRSHGNGRGDGPPGGMPAPARGSRPQAAPAPQLGADPAGRAESPPAQSQPGQSQPAQSQAAQSRPAQSQQAQSQQAQSQPTSQPAESQPVQPQPAAPPGQGGTRGGDH